MRIVLVRVISFFLSFYAFGLCAQNAGNVGDSTYILFSVKKTGQNNSAYRNMKVVQFQKNGYLLAYADSISPNSFGIHTGRHFSKIDVHWPGYWEYRRSVSAGLLTDSAEQWLTDKENNGYPFAKIDFRVEAESDSLLVILVEANEGGYFVIDSLLYGNTHFTPRFVRHMTGIEKGDPYNHQQLVKFLGQLSTLDGISAGKTPVLKVVNGDLKVLLPVNKIGKDYISGIVGLATNPTGNPVFTGEATARFYNVIGSGSSQYFEWRSFKARSQELKISGLFPFLLGAPFGVGYKLEFEKFDTLFSNFSRGLEIRMPLKPDLSMFFGLTATDRLRIYADITAVQSTKQLPANPAIKLNQYHMGFDWRQLPEKTLPERGFALNLKAAVGDRRILRDAAFETFTWTSNAGINETIYDSLARVGQMRAVNYKLNVNALKYVPIAPWLVLKLAAEGSLYRAPSVFYNELERFGGIKNLRGFNEQSIFANQFAMGTAELRIQNNPTGFIGPFYHLAWFNNQSQTAGGSGYLHGIGLSSGLNTAAGVLKIAWALGKSGSAPFAFNQSKFHFGVSTVF